MGKRRNPAHWRCVDLRCECGEAWTTTVLDGHDTVRCRRCDAVVSVPEDMCARCAALERRVEHLERLVRLLRPLDGEDPWDLL